MTVHSAEGKAATDIIQANIDRFKLLADDRNRSEEAGNVNTLACRRTRETSAQA